MNNQRSSPITIYRLLFPTLGLLAVIVTACAPAADPASPTPDLSAALTQAMQTAQAALVTPSPTSTETPLPTATLPPRTPPALPAAFQTGELNPLDAPQSYIPDTCQYLRDKWTSTNAAPGTVVMTVMFHSITKGNLTTDNQISADDQRRLLNDLHDQGFEAITMTQMADFLERNAYIPPRSALLIVDDRHYAEYFDTHFRPFYEQWKWPVVNAYIAKDERPDLWAENAALAAEGWVDYQAHGVIHNINMNDNSSDDYLTGELQGAIENFQKYLNKTPIAVIWPGGDFGARTVQFARKFGYRLGFTVNPRGPVMFNWVPQAGESDPRRPSYLPEGPAGDPLMTLPRYWDTDARQHIDVVRRIGKEAAAYAEQNKAVELDYYDILCAPTYGPIP
ncbi:MAG: polysaccharide deacetylase family protein [Chloroflexota bacterium]